MRAVLFLLLLSLSTGLFASECSEVNVSDSLENVAQLKGFSSCSMRGSIYLFAFSREQSKEIYKNFYECDGQEINVNLELFRSQETLGQMVSAVETKELMPAHFSKDATSLESYISNIEMRNNVKCSELNRYFSRSEDRYFSCGGNKVKVKVTPYIKCTDFWKSL